MSKISLYPLDSTIDPEDKVIGTDGADGADNGVTKNYSIAALGAYINALGVETVSTTDGTFISLTPDTQTIGNVIVTADLSATGTPSTTTFLRGDNTWATPVDTNTTYALTSRQSSLNADIVLTGTPLGGEDIVSLIAGTNIQLVDDGSNNITINSTATGDVSGSGTESYVPIWQTSSTLTDSFLKAESGSGGGTVTVGTGVAIAFDDTVSSREIRFALDGVSRFTITEDTVGVGNANFSTSGYVKVGSSTDTPTGALVGATRYRFEANASYAEMVMQTGDGVYEWVIIQQNTW